MTVFYSSLQYTNDKWGRTAYSYRAYDSIESICGGIIGNVKIHYRYMKYHYKEEED